jgi:Outer membrane protein beta-barrel domain
MKKTLLAAATLGLVGFTSTTFAAPPTASASKWELTLGGTGANDNDFENGIASVNGQLGYYFDDRMQVNVRQQLGYADTGNDNSWTGFTAVGFDYHFDMGQDQRVIPFVGVAIGYRYGDQTNDSVTASPEAGLKWYVNETTFIYGQVAYDFLLKESFGDGSFSYGLGIGFRF